MREKLPKGVFKIPGEPRPTVAGAAAAAEEIKRMFLAIQGGEGGVIQPMHIGIRAMTFELALLCDTTAAMVEFCQHCTPSSAPPLGFDVLCLTQLLRTHGLEFTDVIHRELGRRLALQARAYQAVRSM